MSNKVLLDANVLLDFFLSRNEEAKIISRILYEIEKGSLKGCLTISIIQIVGYWLTKEWGQEKAKKGLLIFINHFEILDGDKKTVISALHSNMKDIEDALQYYTSLLHKVDIIISRDKHFINSAIPALPVCEPKYFVDKYI